MRVLRAVGSSLADLFFQPVVALVSCGFAGYYSFRGDDLSAVCFVLAGLIEYVGWLTRRKLAARAR
jgi:hypothetical protein